MIFVLLIVAAAVGTGLYLLVMYSSIPGAVDERLGTLEPLPDNLGRWVVEDEPDETEAAEGLVREVRILHHPPKGLLGRERLVKQVRYRNAQTGEIERVEPELVLPRKRTKVTS